MVEEVEWAALAEVEAVVESAKMMGFDKPSERMTKHIMPLYIKACINGKTIGRVIVDGGAVLNVMPITTMKKLGRKKEELVPTNMKMTNFTGEATMALGVLVADVMVGTKTLSSDFFVIEAKPIYTMLLGRN